MLWARLVKLEAAVVSGHTATGQQLPTVVNLPPKLGAHNGREDLGQDAHPCFLVHNI